MKYPFVKPYKSSNAFDYLQMAASSGQLAGDGKFTKLATTQLQDMHANSKVLLTPSCTSALEMTALLLGLQAGDEVIMPSYTFVSTANAFVLRGCKPVFVDVRSDNLNIDEEKLEQAITPRTKAIVVVHYAGVACNMTAICKIAADHNIDIIEDSAQGLYAEYQNRPLATFGTFGAISFHETKNIVSGEGGCLVINNQTFQEQAEILREKGTNRSAFLRGSVDKYTWRDVGSSYLPSELQAALLCSQLEEGEYITSQRLKIWQTYYDLLEDSDNEGLLRRPQIQNEAKHNAHIFYVILNPQINRTDLIAELGKIGIQATSHYEPLHLSDFAQSVARQSGDLIVTETMAKAIIRLPLWVGMTQSDVEFIVTCLLKQIK